jgi:hypothetical protein
MYSSMPALLEASRVSLVPSGGERDNANVREPATPGLASRFDAVHQRHLNVQHDEVVRRSLERAEQLHQLSGFASSSGGCCARIGTAPKAPTTNSRSHHIAPDDDDPPAGTPRLAGRWPELAGKSIDTAPNLQVACQTAGARARHAKRDQAPTATMLPVH